jgi:hypothetical protein
MRKRIISPVPQETASTDENWLMLENLADVEVTSESSAHPVESALLPGRASGWRAAAPGKQTMRLLFSSPQRLRRIWLNFVEPHTERTQEYVLRWSPEGGQSFREIVRQQWHFSPQGANSENGRPSRRPPGGNCARIDDHPGYRRRGCSRLFGTVAACLSSTGGIYPKPERRT